MFLSDNYWKFLLLQLRVKFSEKQKPFTKNLSLVFQLKVLRLKMQHFHTNVRQVE